jgi:LmbE family N-acetylglucosaminyl deacetylase
MLKFGEITGYYNNFVFISPHFDDAVLSCGQFILDLKKMGKKVSVITVFTKASVKTVSPQAKSFLAKCGYENANKLFKDREKEDLLNAKYLGINVKYLSFTDAAWRRDANGKPLYHSEKSQFSGKVSKKDKVLIEKVSANIESLINKQKGKYLILAPLSVGGHADHVIIQKIICKLNYPKLFWEDFPYNTNRKLFKRFIDQNGEFNLIYKSNRLQAFKKDRAIRFYKSQTASLFPLGKIPHISENFYAQKKSELP